MLSTSIFFSLFIYTVM